MPTYVYKCKKCENVWEEVHSITDDPEIQCASCDEPAHRVPQKALFTLKGNCWGRDGYRSKKPE
jgi:putative FmdB family regulatory protein